MSNDIDHKFLEELEGYRLKAYVPKDKPGGNESGVTISRGVDLGSFDKNDLKFLSSEDLKNKIKDYVGLRGREAKNKLEKSGGFKITKKQEKELYTVVFAKKWKATQTFLKNKGINVNNLTPKAKTIVASRMWHMGSNLPDNSPKFTQSMKEKNAAKFKNEIKNYFKKDKNLFANRMKKEYNYIQNDSIFLDSPKTQLKDATKKTASPKEEARNFPKLQREAKGPYVTLLQRALNECPSVPYRRLEVDGKFGKNTEARVKSFQQRQKLKIDGIVGNNTWGALARYISTEIYDQLLLDKSISAFDAIDDKKTTQFSPEKGNRVVRKDVEKKSVSKEDLSKNPPSNGQTALVLSKNEIWDNVTNDRIRELHPQVQQPAINFINQVQKQLGIRLRITAGLRSHETQNELYAQGRSGTKRHLPVVTKAKGGQSYHNYGLAIDVVEIKSNNELDLHDDDNDNDNEWWNKIAAIGKQHGFKWGGDWKKFRDRPHFQMTFGLTIKELQTGKRP